MKKRVVSFVGCLVFAAAGAAFAQSSQGGFTGPRQGFAPQQGFSGGPQPVTIAQVVAIFPDRSEFVLVGNLVQSFGNDLYLMRDSTGDIVVRIRHNEWWGLQVGPADLVEIGGRLRRESNGSIRRFEARSIRLAN